MGVVLGEADGCGQRACDASVQIGSHLVPVDACRFPVAGLIGGAKVGVVEVVAFLAAYARFEPSGGLFGGADVGVVEVMGFFAAYAAFFSRGGIGLGHRGSVR